MTRERTRPMARKLVAAVLTFAGFATALTDHRPEGSTGAREADTVLAGIDMALADIDDLVERFGPPAVNRDYYPCTTCPPPMNGSAVYVWQLGPAKLTAATLTYQDETGKKKIELLRFVKVEGPAGASELHTGRGAELGDSADEVSALYGNMPRKTLPRSAEIGVPTMIFRLFDGSELSFLLEEGRVSAIFLAISREGPPWPLEKSGHAGTT